MRRAPQAARGGEKRGMGRADREGLLARSAAGVEKNPQDPDQKRDDHAADRLHPAQVRSYLRHLALEPLPRFDKIGPGRDPSGHSGPHASACSASKPLALSWRVTARVSNAASAMPGKVAPDARRFNPPDAGPGIRLPRRAGRSPRPGKRALASGDFHRLPGPDPALDDRPWFGPVFPPTGAFRKRRPLPHLRGSIGT